MSGTVLVAHPSPDLYGSDRMLLESIDAIVERGHRTVVTLPESGPLLPLIEERGAEVRLCRTPVLRRAYLSPRGVVALAGDAIASARPGMALFKELRPDVLYLSTLTAPEWLALAKAARVPSVCHVHEAESAPSRPIRTALASPLLLADRLVVNSRFSERVLTDVIGRLARRSTVVYNGVVGPAAPVDPRPAIDGPVRLLFVGRLSERKGVLDALDTVAELQRRGRPVRLDVAGSIYPGYEHVETDMARRIAALDDPAAVTLHGYVGDIWPLLAEADVLLVPSRGDEPFGNTAVEGTLARRPVIASASSGLLEAVAGAQAARSVPPGRPAAFADAVEDLVEHWDEVRRLAITDAARAEERYSPARYRSEIFEQLRSLAPTALA
ncbi:glycosyltransferase family 4 protein [Dermatobacter hominis]|uniref:glycosyltransferase family 4 protein n=1 Tax=Dermatobacter hominis TaxID=2884263 RepID=UPI001D10B238|nr:glycosyltransferase family 4 protein [Dermatobacter hominis]UDY35507.1 glycosyltransferase family 4 protein [Dermatobacter hominis]